MTSSEKTEAEKLISTGGAGTPTPRTAGTVNWGTATIVGVFAGLLYGGSKEAAASVSKDAEVMLKLGSTPDKREQYRLMRDAMEKRFLRVARGSIVGGVRLGMFTASFYGLQNLLADKRGVHDVFNIAGAGSATAAMFGLILPGSIMWRARNVLLGSVLGAGICFPLGPSEHSYQPAMTADTTISYYWLNWRVLLCAIWILISMMVAAILLWKYEGSNSQSEEGDETRLKALGTLYDDEAWRPCLNTIHPAWLLAFRVLSFFLLLALLITNAVIDGAGIFYYYTQWTFVLVTIYFGLGSLLSIYGCHQYLNKVGGDRVDHSRLDTEHGIYAAPISERSEIMHQTIKNSMFHEEQNVRKIAGLGGYSFQIIYQTNAGAVMLTDCVFWFIIFPFLAIKDYDLNFILIGMHSVNAIFLLGDIALNSMRFPWFRISYFLLWTSAYVIFQWLVHAFVSIWWPYPFLDLSSPQAPLWYLVVALMHIPCYAIFTVIVKMKHNILSRRFPQSYLNTD